MAATNTSNIYDSATLNKLIQQVNASGGTASNLYQDYQNALANQTQRIQQNNQLGNYNNQAVSMDIQAYINSLKSKIDPVEQKVDKLFNQLRELVTGTRRSPSVGMKKCFKQLAHR